MTRVSPEARHQPVTRVAIRLRIDATAEGHPVPDRPVGTPTLEGTRPLFVFDPAVPLGVDTAYEPEATAFALDAIAAQALQLVAGSDEAVLPALQLGGGAPGGARPKALIGLRREADRVHGIVGVTPAMVRGEVHALPDDYAPWLVKFTSDEDRARFGPDVGVVEACYAVMARQAGLTVAETTLLTDAAGRRHFATARFDRAGPDGRQRVHVHTAGGLLHASFRVPSLDYTALFQLTGVLTRSPAQLRELFRRMIFNVYAYNWDDHAKNVAFRMTADGTWTLAPAYDLMFSPGMHGRHATAINGVDDWPTRAGLLRLGEQYRLTRQDLEQDLAQVREAVAAGPALAREWGCARTTCGMLQARFEEIARRAGTRD